jgi:DNA-binding transcriptional ArsR family regulator
MLNDLDPILHSQLRLAVISTLASVEQADFNYLKEITRATSGNLSVQLNKLKEAGYITIRKKFKGNYPQTLCKITVLGSDRFTEYIKALEGYLKGVNRES